MKTIDQIIKNTIPHAAQIILMESGIDISEEEENKAEYDTISVIGFSGNGFGGALGFAAEKSILKAVNNDEYSTLREGWIGEVSNQLLGRLKNAMLAYGLEFQVAIPMILHGLGIQIRDQSGKIKCFPNTSECGRSCVWLDANWDPNKQLYLAAADQQPQHEGDTTIF